jgi:hypothetical protein
MLANVSMSCLNDYGCVVTATAWEIECVAKDSVCDHARQATMPLN